jgi:hypothetical protein
MYSQNPAWAGFSQSSISGSTPPRGQAMRSLVSAICALGAASLFAGIGCEAQAGKPAAHVQLCGG